MNVTCVNEGGVQRNQSADSFSFVVNDNVDEVDK